MRSLAIIGAALVLLGAALCFPAESFAWEASVFEPGAFRIQRGVNDTDAPTVRLWYRTTPPSAGSWAAGSFDTTGAGNTFTTQIGTITLDASDRVVEYRSSYVLPNYWFLIDLNGESVCVQNSGIQSVAVTSSVPITASVVGTLPVSMATSASIAGTLPVTLTDDSLPPWIAPLGAIGAFVGGMAVIRWSS